MKKIIYFAFIVMTIFGFSNLNSTILPGKYSSAGGRTSQPGCPVYWVDHGDYVEIFCDDSPGEICWQITKDGLFINDTMEPENPPVTDDIILRIE